VTSWIAETLWDLLGRRPRPAARKPVVRVNKPRIAKINAPSNNGHARQTMQQKYDAIVVEMKSTYNVNVRKWRKSSSGVAWEIRYRDGRTRKCIESPYPRGPMSAAIFLHEIGHHAIGLGIHKPRCLEEYHVWVWALNTMRERGLNVTPAVEKRMEQSMKYAVRKAKRRGIRAIPPELVRYT